MITYRFENQRAPTTKLAPVEDGFRRIPDGYLVGDLEVIIDLEGIARSMGARALKAKGRTCRDGFVTVRARNIRHEP